jgi:hypothetical protein
LKRVWLVRLRLGGVSDAREEKNEDEQWPDCPREKRGLVHNINLAIRDMQNPCELAQQLGVKISDLWSREVRDGSIGGTMLNDIYLPGGGQDVIQRETDVTSLKPKPKAQPKQSRRKPKPKAQPKHSRRKPKPKGQPKQSRRSHSRRHR